MQKKYYSILETGEPTPLLPFTPNKQIHISKALTALSKFTGCYRQWQQTIEDYNLRMVIQRFARIFHSIMNEQTSLNAMIQWVRNSIKKIPEIYANIIIYNVLTGLRPSESCASIGLVQHDLSNYYNKEKSLLEHFKYPEAFIRRTKKCYISIVNDQIMDIAKRAYDKPSYNALKLLLSRKGLGANMYYCRKVFATHLRNNNINQEIIELLQGRIGKSIFVKHYYRPDFISSKITDVIIHYTSKDVFVYVRDYYYIYIVITLGSIVGIKNC
jgi:hypothetical protein